MENRRVRFMVVRKRGLYIATCIDLCICAQADSVEEVMEKLLDQVNDQINEAEAHPEFADDIFKRKIPLSMKIEYWYTRLFIDISRWLRMPESHRRSTRELRVP